MAGTIIQGLIVLNNPDYEFRSWHGTLLVIAVALAAIIVTTFFAAKVPAIETALLYPHFAGFFAIMITLWVMGTKANAREVLLDFENNGGWPSTGLAAMIGLIASLNALVRCPGHMSKTRLG